MQKILSAILLVLLLASIASGQVSGKLQVYFADLGQGDAANLNLFPQES